MERYIFEGQGFEVETQDLEAFKLKYPNATKVDEPGKINDSAIADPIAESNVMGSNLEDGSSELPEDKGFIEDIVQVFRQSKATAATIDDAFDVYKLGKDISDEQIQSILDAKAEMDKYGPTNEQVSFAKDQKANGGGVVGTLLALKDNPGFIPQFLVGSAVTMAGSLQAGEVRGATALSAGVGAAGGAAAGSTGFTLGPLGAATTAAGAVTGTFSGAIGGLVGSMETGLTLMDLIQEEVGEGVKLTKENIRAVIDDTETFEKIKQRAAARGRNIGAVEAMTLGISRGVGSQLVKAGKFRRAGVATTAIETTGGFTGEVAGQIGAEQDIDLGEATLEAIGEVTGAGQVINVGEIVKGTLQKSEYNINGEKRSKQEILDLIESDKLTNEEKTKIKFNIKNDEKFAQLINGKLYDISLETQIDAKVEDPADRAKLVDLEKQRAKAEVDTKKSGIFKVINADTRLENIEEQINEIVGKYTAIDGRTADVRARKKTAERVRENIADKNFEANLDFAKKHSKLYGLEVEDNLTQEQIKEKYGDDLANSLGGIVDNKLVINKKLAKTRVYGDNVANHELLHGIIKASGQKKDITQKTIDDFLNIIGEENKAKIQDRIDKNYTPEYMAENLDEYFTIFSDAIANNEIKFNDSIFTKVKDSIRRTFASLGYTKVDFKTGQGAYNFLKDYNKSIHKGALASGVIKATKGEGKVETPKLSKSASDNVQRIYEEQGVAGAMDIIEQFKPITSKIAERRREAPNFDRELLMSEIEIGKRGIFDLIRAYDPNKGVPLAAYINDNLPKRAIEASKRVLGEEFTEDITEKVDIAAEEVAEPTVTTKPKPKKIVLADRLNVKSKVNETIKKQIPKLNVSELTFKKLKNLVPEIIGEKFGINPRKLKTLANITKKELQTAQMFINKNADLLISMLPEGSTQSGTATGVPNSLLKAFYTKTDRAKMAKTGSTSGLPIQIKNKINKKEFLETFGIIDGKPTRDDRNTSARVLALANLTGKVMTNQAVRENLQLLGNNEQTIQNIKDGTSSIMFSKSNTVFQKHGLPDLNINDPKNGFNNFDVFTDKMVLLATYGKPGLIRAVDLRGNITNSAVKDYARSTTLYEELGLFTVDGKLNGVKLERVYLRPDAEGALGKNVKNITKAKAKRYNEVSKANFNDMIDMIKKAIKDNPKDKVLHSAIFEYLSSAVNDTSHPMRAGAEYVGGDITATGKIIYEHALQNANVRDVIMDALLDKKQDFNKTLKAIKKNYKLIALSEADAKAVDTATYIDENGNEIKYKNGMGVGWDIFVDNWFDRYFNTDVNAVNPNNIVIIENGKTFADEYGVTMSGKSPIIKSNLKPQQQFSKAVNKVRITSEPKGITVLDFDDTLATTESLVKYTAPDGATGTLNAEQFASTYQDLQDQGFTFDFSDFNKVVKGKLAPLFNKAIKLQGKFGPENMFVLTARPPQAQKAIFDFLKANGLNIPLKNITGLGNSTSEAKALWIADKVGEGYNDFYFADDALQNVQAVKNMLDQFDVKSKVQQAKVKFSKSIDKDFNDILEEVTGIEAKKRFSDVKARKRGASKGKFRFFIPPSHEDFVGLLYNFMGKGRKGDQHRNFFEQALVRPLNRAYREIDTAKQAIANDYKQLNKQFTGVKKKLKKKTPDGDFIFEDAVRIYLWNKHGYDIPGLSPSDQQNLVDLITNDSELQSYAETLNIISKQDMYVDPGKGWEGGNIKTDLIDATGRVGRAEYFAEFNENADILFSPENLNKIEAAYGKDFRSALEDMLHRIKTGVNRPKGQTGTINKFMNYLNGSVGTVMFFNVRSAILQQMSIVNYINFADNNVFAAAKAFSNQPQYWKDFAFIFNSDMLKQRRGGIGTDINGADLAQAVKGSKDPTKVVIGRLLKLGFLPTQIGDNIAIATGGATFYRNRVNKYIKDGLSKKEAEAKAFTDFQDLTQSTQQSSRPDMTSKQQASWIGKLVLNFQNITSQYNRIIKKAALDIGKGRISPPYTTKAQSNLGNLSKILYYGGIQNVIFYSLQTALFAVMFGDDEDEDQILKKSERVIQGTIDSILRGAGIYGAVASTLKNAVRKWKEQRDKGYNKDESAVLMELLNFSPVVGIKARQIVNAEKTINYNENIISEMETFDADNPQWSAVTNYTQALTNFPANRLYQKSINMRNALDKDYTNFQRVMFFSGYTTWSLGLGDNEAIIEAKEKAGINKKNTKSKGVKQRKVKERKVRSR